MKKIIVLGAGLVGRPMVLDLLGDSKVELAVADYSAAQLERFSEQDGIQTIEADLSDENVLKSTIAGYDYVINAVPGYMGYQSLKYILEAGKNVVDIAFSPEDLSDLNELALQNNVTALVDFGVAPGLSHLVVAHSAEMMDSLDLVRIYVGGLPKRRSKPFEYAAVFSPIDVIEEYTRPARLVREGHLLVKEALTDIEELEFDRVGTLEAFNSDGLRSLVDSIKVKDMAEKTLRYPGHAALMKVFRDTGFFDEKKIDVKGQAVAPIDLTAKLMFPKWEMKEGDRDITVMKVISEGWVDDKAHRYEFDLYDEWHESTGIHSMARTTGYTATMGLRLLMSGAFTQKGVFYPEKLGANEDLLTRIIEGLKARDIEIQQRFFSL